MRSNNQFKNNTNVGVVPLVWDDLGPIAKVQGFGMYGTPSVVTTADGQVIIASARTVTPNLLSSGVSTDGHVFSKFAAMGDETTFMNPLVSLVSYYGNLYAFGSQNSAFKVLSSKYDAGTYTFLPWGEMYTDSAPVQNLACANFTSDANVDYLVCTWQQSGDNKQYIGYVQGDDVASGFTSTAYLIPVITAYSVALFQGPIFSGSERRNGLFLVYIEPNSPVSAVKFATTVDPTNQNGWQLGTMDITISALSGVTGSVLPVTECENTVLIAYATNITAGTSTGPLAYFLFDTSMEFVSQSMPIISSSGQGVPATSAPGFTFLEEKLWMYSVNTTSTPVSRIDVFSTPINDVLGAFKPTACKQHNRNLVVKSA